MRLGSFGDAPRIVIVQHTLGGLIAGLGIGPELSDLHADLHNGIASELALLALGIPVADSGAAWNIGSF